MKKKQEAQDPFEFAYAAEEALRLAVYEAIKDHERTGDPVVLWKDGKVVHVPASKLKIKKPPLKYKPKLPPPK